MQRSAFSALFCSVWKKSSGGDNREKVESRSGTTLGGTRYRSDLDNNLNI